MFNATSKLALALTVIVGISASASAQSIVGTPMAGSAGAGNSAINGIPLGPANPGVRSDPSGCAMHLEWLRPGRPPSASRRYRTFSDLDRIGPAAPYWSVSIIAIGRGPARWKW